MAKKKNIKAALTPTLATKTHPRTCKCHKCIAHPSGCKCRHCKWQTRSKRWHRRRRYIPRRRGFIPYPPEDESKVREDIFDKVYKYFEVGTYEAVTRECRKLVQTCDLCKGTGIEKKIVPTANDGTDMTKLDPLEAVETRLCPRCSDARYALKVLDGLRESAADVKPKVILKEQP